MKVSDYIVNFFVEKNICDFFGYQGTMIAHLIDSIGKNEKAHNHVCYNEQGASFAACGYSSSTGKCGVAYATSGPGALNLVSGIANAYYDSIPVVFITGQINTYERHDEIEHLRQSAFQETKTAEICRPITKFSKEIRDPAQIPAVLEQAYRLATTGRKGPVVLDIPMNVQRAEIEISERPTVEEAQAPANDVLKALGDAIRQADRPVLMFGNGIAKKNRDIFIQFAEQLNLPVVTSLMAKDMLPYDHRLNFGFIGGAYGHRYANMIVAGKADQIIAIGCSLCTRQTGTKVEAFAPNAKVMRIDIDGEELKRKIKEDEISFQMDSAVLAELLINNKDSWTKWTTANPRWVDFCVRYKQFCEEFDQRVTYSLPNQVVDTFNQWIQPGDIVACDVGQHMMWIAQSLHSKKDLTLLLSGAHGAMGYALPASIGAGVANPGKTIYCFCGDGAVQMNIQELQWLKNENLDVVLVVFNNQELGLITQQQTAYFDKNYFGSASPEFTVPEFARVAEAYGISSARVSTLAEVDEVLTNREKGRPMLVEFMFHETTKAYPKTILGEKIYNQEPALPAAVLDDYLNEEV